jgi:hypothetical protein
VLLLLLLLPRMYVRGVCVYAIDMTATTVAAVAAAASN